jgi:hypothetical protein
MHRELDARVECRAEYSGCDAPVAVHWEGEILPVREILREWRTPGLKHYHLQVEDGRQFQVSLDELNGKWRITLIT